MVQYHTLNQDTAEIRLLELLPGKEASPIHCKLATVSLQNNAIFEALSYVWGDAQVTKAITVDGGLFQVTTNLEEALRALRHRCKSRILWMDAICINQSDLGEKNVQVPLMRQIYTNAGGVVAWLGPSNPSIEMAVSYGWRYAEKRLSSKTLYWMRLDLAAVFSRRARMERSIALLQVLDGQLDILLRPYWKRIWTFQEYHLPRRKPIYMCRNMVFQAYSTLEHSGSEPFPFSRVFGGDELQDPNAIRMLDMRDIDYDGLRGLVSALLEKSVGLGVSDRRPHYLIVDPGPPSDTSTDTDLLGYLLESANRLFSEPRDRVYALYGMVKEVRELYPPDYSKPVEQVLLETSAFLVNHEKDIPRGWFPPRADSISNQSYPTWVPDFNLALPDLHPHIHPIVSEKTRTSKAGFGISDDQLAAVDKHLATLGISAWNIGPVHVVLNFASTTIEVLQQMRGLLLNRPSSCPPPRVFSPHN